VSDKLKYCEISQRLATMISTFLTLAGRFCLYNGSDTNAFVCVCRTRVLCVD